METTPTPIRTEPGETLVGRLYFPEGGPASTVGIVALAGGTFAWVSPSAWAGNFETAEAATAAWNDQAGQAHVLVPA